MSFLHGWMLWFLPLAALPILLHLLTLHRLKTVELPTFRFLFDSYIQQRRNLRFLEALLAMLRTLFVLFIVFLVCRPVVKHWDALFGKTTGAGGREVILLVDAGASMNAKTAGVAAMERAKAAALSVVDRLSSSDQVTLVRVGARPEELLSRFNTDTAGIKARIEGLAAGSGRANLFAALQRLFGPEAARRANPAVYVFTDCRAAAWKEAKNQGLERLLPGNVPFTVVNVGPSEAGENRAVVGTAPRKNRAVVGLPFVLTPRVANYGKAEADVTLSVVLDEKEVARTQLTLKPGETATRTVVHTPSEPGVKRGRFEISTRTPDVFPDDDRFLFILDVRPKVRVVVVNGNASPDPMLDEAVYIRTALASQADAPAEAKGAVPGVREIAKSLDVVTVPPAGVTADALRDAGVVVVANAALDAAAAEAVRGFVREGGGLLVFPGDKVAPQVYNDTLFAVPGPSGESLTAAKLLPPVGDPDKGDAIVGLEFDLSHPALGVFDPKEAFKTMRVYKRFPLEMPAKAGNAWTVAAVEGSRIPAIVESRFGDGVVLLASFPAHARWGNLPLKPDFVPLLLRLVAYAERRPEADVPGTVAADAAAELTVSAAWEPAEATVRTPTGATLPLPLERAGARLLGAFDRTDRHGYYAVEVRSNRADLRKAASPAFAVNLSPEASDPALVGKGDIAKLLPASAAFTFVDASAEAQELHGDIGKEREVWPVLIWVLFAVIGAEFLLSTLNMGRPEGEDGPTLTEQAVSVGTGAWVGRMTGADEGK